MPVPRRIENAAVNRISKAVPDIRHTIQKVAQGCPLDAEPQEQRKTERIAAVVKVPIADAQRLARYEDPKAVGLTGESLAKAEALQGKTVDYLGVAWLEAGRIASRAVARILFADGSPNGTGFLISNRLLLTNNHVLSDPNSAAQAIVEFSYELALGNKAPNAVRFRLDPQIFFETDSRDDLDFTVVALGQAITSGATLTDFGSCPLSASAAKHLVGEQVNVIEHPDGDYKQVVVRESRIVHRGDTVLHYLADTEPGSSGSPVFNDQWQTVALHHWGGPHRELTDANGQMLSQDVNEGIRISCIIDELTARISRMPAEQNAMLQEALNAPAAGDFGTRVVTIPSTGPQTIIPSPVQPITDGGLNMNPIITPMTGTSGEAAGGPPASRIDRNYSNRRGYNTRFLSQYAVNLPQLSRAQQKQAARVRSVGNPPNPFELKYEHFSVVVNAVRRMPFFSICNIDGAKRIHVDRDTGKAVSQPEATENWAIDPRIPPEAQLSDPFYQRLRSAFRAADFFARGHMTRREDPDWGTAPSAEKANNDTFHHTNACPQVNTAFNASQKVWAGIENFILNSTDDANLRVTVITGPVFENDDPEFDDAEFGPIRLPRRFWKIVARVEDGTPKVFAILADQSPFMNAVMKPAGGEAAVPFVWPSKLSREFRSTVQHITDLTGLDFGDLVNHDVFASSEESLKTLEITGAEQLFPKPANDGAFGDYASIGDFLEAFETARQPKVTKGEESHKPQPAPQAQPEVVEVDAQVDHVFPDDLSGAKHQQFSVRITNILHADPRAQADLQNTKTKHLDVRLAVRFGDSLGLPDRIPGIRSGVALHIKGEWISAAQAGSVGGQHTAVLHFTHKPLGFICTPAKCYS